MNKFIAAASGTEHKNSNQGHFPSPSLLTGTDRTESDEGLKVAHLTSRRNLSRLCYSCSSLLVYCAPGSPPAEQVIRGEGNLQRQHYSGPTTVNTTSSSSSNPCSAISSTCNLMSSRWIKDHFKARRGVRCPTVGFSFVKRAH